MPVQDGKVEQSNFNDYPVVRMNEMPVVEVHLAKSAENPGGVGEPGTPPIAPAVANAIFALASYHRHSEHFERARSLGWRKEFIQFGQLFARQR